MVTRVDAPPSQPLPTVARLIRDAPTTDAQAPVGDEPADAPSADTALLTNIVRRAAEYRQIGDALAQMVLYDPVTELPNRLLFQDRLNHVLAQADRYRRVVALLLVGLSRVDGPHLPASGGIGHQEVAEVARQLRRCTRTSDTVARLDDAEFAAILPDVERGENAGVVARRILEVLSPSYIEGHQATVQVAVGIGLYPRDSQDGETLLRNARTALRHARRNSGQSYRFFTHLSVL
jgi:diguanylate cyclase (GGDEF)-like protein